MDSPKFQKVMNSNLINSWTTTLKRKNIYKFLVLIDSLHGFKKIDEDIISQLNIFIKKKNFHSFYETRQT